MGLGGDPSVHVWATLAPEASERVMYGRRKVIVDEIFGAGRLRGHYGRRCRGSVAARLIFSVPALPAAEEVRSIINQC